METENHSIVVVEAAPGRLGISISEDDHKVEDIRLWSPLMEKIEIGDEILKVNEFDTDSLSLEDLVEILQDLSDKQETRRLTIKRTTATTSTTISDDEPTNDTTNNIETEPTTTTSSTAARENEEETAPSIARNTRSRTRKATASTTMDKTTEKEATTTKAVAKNTRTRQQPNKRATSSNKKIKTATAKKEAAIETTTIASATSKEIEAPIVSTKETWLEKTWKINFRKLAEFQRKHGHCHIPPTDELYKWVKQQRKKHNEKATANLTPEQIELLEGIGFEWSSANSGWFQKYEELKAWKAKTGSVDVCPPQGKPGKKANLGLRHWASYNRQQYSLLQKGEKSQMTTLRVNLLNEIGFIWDKQAVIDSRWEEMFQRLVKYKIRFHHSHVPSGWKEDPKLANWVDRQRLCHRTNEPCLTQERRTALESIGFQFVLVDTISKNNSSSSSNQNNCNNDDNNNIPAEELSAPTKRSYRYMKTVALHQLMDVRKERIQLQEQLAVLEEKESKLQRRAEKWNECVFCNSSEVPLVVLLPCKHTAFCNNPECMSKSEQVSPGTCPVCGMTILEKKTQEEVEDEQDEKQNEEDDKENEDDEVGTSPPT